MKYLVIVLGLVLSLSSIAAEKKVYSASWFLAKRAITADLITVTNAVNKLDKEFEDHIKDKSAHPDVGLSISKLDAMWLGALHPFTTGTFQIMYSVNNPAPHDLDGPEMASFKSEFLSWGANTFAEFGHTHMIDEFAAEGYEFVHLYERDGLNAPGAWNALILSIFQSLVYYNSGLPLSVQIELPAEVTKR